MGVLQRSAATALRLIGEYGEAVSWVVQDEPFTPDPTKPWISVDGTPSSVPVSILFTVDRSSPFLKLMAGSVVESSGQKGLMPAQSFTPKADDVVIRSDDSKLVIESATPLAPNGAVILWYLVFKA